MKEESTEWEIDWGDADSAPEPLPERQLRSVDAAVEVDAKLKEAEDRQKVMDDGLPSSSHSSVLAPSAQIDVSAEPAPNVAAVVPAAAGRREPLRDEKGCALIRGQRVQLASLGFSNGTLEVSLRVPVLAGGEIDLVCLPLNGNLRLEDEGWFVFFNQPSAPGGILRIAKADDGQQVITLELQRLPAWVEHLVIAGALPGEGTLARLGKCELKLKDDARELAAFQFSGSDFLTERAVILAEVYRRADGWRLAIGGQGFAGGLAALLSHYQVRVAE